MPELSSRKSEKNVSGGAKSSRVSSAKAAKIVEAMGDLPAMPHIATQVMDKLSNPNSTPKDIHNLITKDQGLAALVLKVANSPYYGASRSISSLRDAILFMGFDSIRSLIMTAVLKGMFSSLGLAEKLLWEHSIGCGVAAREIGNEIGFQAAEEAFLAGLMHDIGKAVLVMRLPDVMRDIMQETYNNGTSFVEAEQQALGFTHAEIGQIVADKWRFALDIEEAIGNHHSPEQANSAQEMTYIISLANSLCHKLEVGPTRKPDLELFELESFKVLGISVESMGKVAEAVRNALKSETSD